MLICKSDPQGKIRWKEGERLDHLFEQQCDALERAGKHNHSAVITSQQTYSFAQLDERANQVARYLMGRGIIAGDRIAVLFGNSFETYVALLAVMKAGAAYVPLDASFPGERINFIARDAGVKAIVSLSDYRDNLSTSALPKIMLDEVEVDIDAQSTNRLSADEKGPDEDLLAYIIYTSGTTGNPKGVAVEHSSICNFVRVAAQTYGYGDADRVYQGMTIAFDFSVEELWVPLMAGAALVPGRSEASLVGGELHDFLLQNKVTALCCVPTLLATMEEDLPDMRLLLVSGEACPHDLVVRWHKEGRTILNAYGPTEATVTATITELHPDKAVTIGGPLPTYTIVMLDPDEDKTVPDGRSGEIGIAGIGLAREYLNHAELTREKFIPDFLNIENNPSGRIYRTGDLGCITPEGEIEYQGRIDTQVKIRGYRIELTEIESIILQRPEVAQAAVDIFETSPGMKELVAYYSLTSEAKGLDHDELAGTLKSQLPNYMVPAYFERLDTIPMTPSHKTDRKNLPAPKTARHRASSQDYVAPKSELEKQVAEAFAQVMQIEQVSVADNFFSDLGAHSLLMARFCAEVRERLPEAEISMREVYQNPSVAELVRHLEFVGSKEPVQPSLQVDETPLHIPSTWQYYSCGLLQFLTYIVLGLSGFYVLITSFHWVYASVDNNVALYGRILTVFLGLFIGLSALSIAAKWLLIGRWREQSIPVWSFAYYRFWLAKLFISSSPMMLFMGGPLYNVYLRLLGARIGKNAVLFSVAPVCADLFMVGDNALVRKDVLLPGYYARNNHIHIGAIEIGTDSFVGSNSVMEIDTSIGDNAQLGHSSTLHQGARVASGKHFHGTPAQETDTDYCTLPSLECSALRRWSYTLVLFVFAMLSAPIAILIAFNVLPWLYKSFELGQLTNSGFVSLVIQLAPVVFVLTSVLFVTALLFALVSIHFIPRLLNRFIEPEKAYILFGVHYYVQSWISGASNSKGLNILFGDSSYIVKYLNWVGYKLNNIIQTGANFGLEQRHDNPFLCDIGSGTIVSDGLIMANTEFSSSSFRVGPVKIGDHNYLGNSIFYPTGGRTGSNNLIATKAMIPVDGLARENTGLLGSPCFEIPRACERDRELIGSISKEQRETLIESKNRFNLMTMALFLFANWFLAFLVFLFGLVAVFHYPLYGNYALLAYGISMPPLMLAYWVIMEKASLRFGSLESHIVSMYDDYFLFHERHWKFTAHPLQSLFPGTPFKSILARLTGIKMGRMVFDDGAVITDKTLMEIGDHVNLNKKCVLQGHSLEEGVFKSDKVKIGDGCSIGIGAFVHYSVQMGEHSSLGSNAFLMKGESVPAKTIWQGNPARFVAHNAVSK